VASDKHGPNRLNRYLEIHETFMAGFRAEGFVESYDLPFDEYGGGTIICDGRIECGCLYIDVTKMLSVLDDEGASSLVQTQSYSYNVVLRGVGNVFRYCSSHATELAPEHNPWDHRHHFDVFAGDKDGTVAQCAWPALSEVIREAQEWVATHRSTLIERGLLTE
jgi:hypothetical protein